MNVDRHRTGNLRHPIVCLEIIVKDFNFYAFIGKNVTLKTGACTVKFLKCPSAEEN
jgi:hypothetical protein